MCCVAGVEGRERRRTSVLDRKLASEDVSFVENHSEGILPVKFNQLVYADARYKTLPAVRIASARYDVSVLHLLLSVRVCRNDLRAKRGRQAR